MLLHARVPPRSAPQLSAVEPLTLGSHVRYLSEVALLMPPQALGAVAALLTSRGEELVEPGSDLAMHPLLVPLTRSPEDGEVTGLLRWPGASGGGSKLPLVRTDGIGLRWLAPGAEEFLHRELVLADAEGNDEEAFVTAGSLAATCDISYERGAAASSAGGTAGFVITKVAPFMQEYERLAASHMAKASEQGQQAALITCERNQACFAAWGRPFAFHALRLLDLEREEEARDLARQALRFEACACCPGPYTAPAAPSQTPNSCPPPS